MVTGRGYGHWGSNLGRKRRKKEGKDRIRQMEETK